MRDETPESSLCSRRRDFKRLLLDRKCWKALENSGTNSTFIMSRFLQIDRQECRRYLTAELDRDQSRSENNSLFKMGDSSVG